MAKFVEHYMYTKQLKLLNQTRPTKNFFYINGINRTFT